MDYLKNLEKITQIIELFESSSVGQGFRVLSKLAEAKVDELLRSPNKREKLVHDDDEWLPPSEVERFFGLKHDYIRKQIVPEFEMKSNGLEGKARRYRRSEIERVAREMDELSGNDFQV